MLPCFHFGERFTTLPTMLFDYIVVSGIWPSLCLWLESVMQRCFNPLVCPLCSNRSPSKAWLLSAPSPSRRSLTSRVDFLRLWFWENKPEIICALFSIQVFFMRKLKMVNLKQAILQAWKERWSDYQWAVNIKKNCPKGATWDYPNLAGLWGETRCTSVQKIYSWFSISLLFPSPWLRHGVPKSPYWIEFPFLHHVPQETSQNVWVELKKKERRAPLVFLKWKHKF